VASASILTSTKKTLGIAPDNTDFDTDILMHINAQLASLNQIGIGPDAGLMIEDDSITWADFMGDDPRLNLAQQYVFLRVRVVFDPPTSSWHAINSINSMIDELYWRLSIKREGESWTDPTPAVVPELETLIVLPVNDLWGSGGI